MAVNYHVTPGVEIWYRDFANTVTAGVLLGYCANDEPPQVRFNSSNREITTSRYGDTVDEVLHAGRSCSLTFTLNKWDIDLLKELQYAPVATGAVQDTTRYNLAGDAGVGYVVNNQTFELAYNVPYTTASPLATENAVWEEYQFAKCYLAEDSIQILDVGNEAARCIVNVNVLRDSASDAFYTVTLSNTTAGPIWT